MRAVDITWAGGEHPFLLNIELLRALQTKCDAGPAYIMGRLSGGSWLVDDVIETIRLGLEGGGATKDQARKLVRQHVEERALANSVMTAQIILMAALFGSEDDPVGEQVAGATTETIASREESGSSPHSTEPESSLD